MPTYTCEFCKKVFNQKIDFTRHQNKKAPCITLTEMQQISQTKEVKMDNKTTLIKLFKNCLNILRDNEGLTGEKALRTISYLLILKLLEPHFGCEINIDDYEYDFSHIQDEMVENHKNKLLEIVRFSNLSNEKEDNIPANMEYLWDDILSSNPTTRNIFLKGKGFDIQHKSTYKKLIDKLNSIDLSNNEYDVLGNAYEEVIQDIMTGKVLGQFFTQPFVKKMMVKLVNPQIHPDGKIDTCGDPTMGTGGFLITYLQYILQQATVKNIKPDWNFIKSEGLYGKELEPDTYQLAVSNMLISSGHMFEELERGDSIRQPITRKFDNILANPPFGIKGLKYDDFQSPLKSEYVPIKTDNAVSLFIQAIIYMLKINGKCAVVLPDGQDLFSKTNTTLVAIREYLMKTCDLKEIIYLPSGIFTYTSIKTCVFYFVKKREGTDVLETKIKVSKTQKKTGRDYKFSKTHQTTKVKFYDCNPYEDVKNLLVEVPIEKIVSNSYSLNYAEYMKDDTEEEQYEEGVVVKTLGEVCKFDIGGTPSRSKNEYYENGNNPWVSVRELNGGYIYDTKEKITDLGVQNSSVKLFAKDTILFSFKLSIGKTAIVGNPLYTNEAIAGILSKDNDLLNNKYLYYYLTINDFSKLGSGILGNGSLNKKSLEQIKIPIPSLEHQQEIVKYLDFIYEKAIKTSNEKIAELKQLNEFCLNNQKIFGENVVKTLGEVCNFKNGKGIKKDRLVEGEYPVIGGGQKPMGFHNEYNTNENTILCSSSGAYAGFISKYDKKVWASDCFSIIPKDESIENNYLYYLLKISQDKIYKSQTGTAQPHVYSKDLQDLKISIPSLERQKEIVEYCEYNDTLIKQLEKEIENNKKQAQQFITGIVKAQVKEEVEEQTETSSVNAETNQVIQDTLSIEEVIIIEPKLKTKVIIKKEVKKPPVIVEDVVV
jgi:type I restriction-modification system DNA methylase subunit/restriction endonuclease S subunit